MIIRTLDDTEIEVLAGCQGEVRMNVRPPGIVGSVAAELDPRTCEELLRGLQAELKKAAD